MASDKRPPLTMVCTVCRLKTTLQQKIKQMCLTEWNLKNTVLNVENMFRTEKKGRNFYISIYPYLYK